MHHNPNTHYYGAAWSHLTGLGHNLVLLAIAAALITAMVIAVPAARRRTPG